MSLELIIGLLASAILAYVIPKISPYIDKLISLISSFFLNHVPNIIRNYFRARRLKKHNHIRKIRYNQDAVIFQIIKAHSYFILLWLLISFYALLMIIGPYMQFIEDYPVLSSVCFLPIYIFEVFLAVRN